MRADCLLALLLLLQHRGRMSARSVRAERSEGDGWLRVELEFAEAGHAPVAVWSLGPDAEVLGPADLRAALAERAAATAARYGGVTLGTPPG